MKTPTKILIGSLLTFLVLVVVFLGLQHSESESDEPNSVNATQHDASEKVINQAIEQKNTGLCKDVTMAKRPGPTDAMITVTGQDAVEWCKQQVEAGQRLYGG